MLVKTHSNGASGSIGKISIKALTFLKIPRYLGNLEICVYDGVKDLRTLYCLVEPYNKDLFPWNNYQRNSLNDMRHQAAENNKKAVEFYKKWIVEECGGNISKINEVWRTIDSIRKEGTTPYEQYIKGIIKI